MNKKKIYISITAFVVILILAVIVYFVINKKYNPDAFEKSNKNKINIFTDYKFSDDFNDTSYIFLTESSDYFFLSQEYSNNNIYKINKKTGVAEIICNNPQCSHSDNTCGACIIYPEDSIWLNYYNERLYYLCSFETDDELLKESWLMSMDLEGKDRKKEIKVNDIIVNSKSGWAMHMAAYGEEMYLAKTYREPDEENVSRNMGTEIYKIDLDTKEMIKIYERIQEGTGSAVAAKKGNTVYFSIRSYNNCVLIYDEKTGNITEEEIGNKVFLGVSGGNMFYSTPHENEGRILVKKSGSQEYEEVINLGKSGTECAIDIYNNYIIVNNWPVRSMKEEDRCITIYDIEGNLVKKISTAGYTLDTKIANGFLFIEKENENNQYDIYVCPIETDTNTWTKIN